VSYITSIGDRCKRKNPPMNSRMPKTVVIALSRSPNVIRARLPFRAFHDLVRREPVRVPAACDPVPGWFARGKLVVDYYGRVEDTAGLELSEGNVCRRCHTDVARFRVPHDHHLDPGCCQIVFRGET